MTAPEQQSLQQETVCRALELGINWFDTAATYGNGASEVALGRALAACGALERAHIATKVRLDPANSQSIAAQIERSVEQSLARLGLGRITLLQLHNSVTRQRGELPTSLAPHDVLGPRGVAAAFTRLKAAGVVAHLGLTGLGETSALLEVIQSGLFETIQLPVNLLLDLFPNRPHEAAAEPDHRLIIAECARRGMGVFAIRLLAGGALAGHPPSDYTRVTRFFTLAQYERDLARARALRGLLPADLGLEELALRHILACEQIASAIIGFAHAEQVEQMALYARRGGLSAGSLGLGGAGERANSSSC